MEMSPVAARVLSSLLEERTGQQLSPGRRWRLDTTLTPMLRTMGIETIDRLAALLSSQRDGELARNVVEALLNNETSFFRDAAAFDALMEEAARSIAAARSDRRLRIWCAGCSTGQEAYSLAMRVSEPNSDWAAHSIDILGTDISRTAIQRAREGLYSQFEIQRGLGIRQMMQWFAKDGESWRASPALRRRVRFEVQSLLDPAHGRFDIILCRNVLLYFSSDTRRQVFDRLADAIAPDGLLMLGAGETVIGHTSRFAADPQYRGFYRPVALASP